MRIAVISDIHANLEALTSVFEDIDRQSVAKIICLGDIVGYGCNPNECITLVQERCEIILMGNHDEVAHSNQSLEHYNYAAKAAAEWTRGRLSKDEKQFLANLPFKAQDSGLLFVHASPWQPQEWHYVMTRDEARVSFDCFEEPMCFFGHTHIPMIYSQQDDSDIRQQAGHSFSPNKSARYIINVGSVGQPRDDDPRACYVMIDLDDKSLEFRRVEYDVQTTQRKMSECGMPEILVERLAVGR